MEGILGPSEVSDMGNVLGHTPKMMEFWNSEQETKLTQPIIQLWDNHMCVFVDIEPDLMGHPEPEQPRCCLIHCPEQATQASVLLPDVPSTLSTVLAT